MANYKYLQHTAEEFDAAVEQQRQHCDASDLHVCAEDKAALAGCVASISEIKSEDGITRATLGARCKNVLKSEAITGTKNGVTFTVNADSTISINGVCTADYNYYCGEVKKPGKYIINGYPEDAVFDDYRIMGRITKSDNTETWFGAELEQPITINATNISVKIYIKVKTNITYSNVVMAPMLRYAEVTDPTYEPYTPNLQTQLDALTARIAALESAAGIAAPASLALDDPLEPVSTTMQAEPTGLPDLTE